MNATKCLLSALGGVVIGLAAGLLLAPKSGEQTRNEIADVLRKKFPKLSKAEADEIADDVVNATDDII